MSSEVFLSLANLLSPNPTTRNKGNSLLETPSEYVSIDLETTGLDPRYDSIIELSAIHVINGKEISTFDSLVFSDYSVGEFITELTGITDEMLSCAPTLETVLPKFVDFIGDHIILGHNVNFDVNFIYDNLQKISSKQFSNDFIDTMRLSRKLYRDMSNHKLDTLISYCGVPQRDKHRALNDARATYLCFEHMKGAVISQSIDISALGNWKSPDLKTLTTENTSFDEGHPLFNRICVFTGVLEKMKQADAAQLVVDLGGSCGNSVTKKTNYLILGNNDYCSSIKDGKSGKQKKAEGLQLSGSDIQIISEQVFYDMISET